VINHGRGGVAQLAYIKGSEEVIMNYKFNLKLCTGINQFYRTATVTFVDVDAHRELSQLTGNEIFVLRIQNIKLRDEFPALEIYFEPINMAEIFNREAPTAIYGNTISLRLVEYPLYRNLYAYLDSPSRMFFTQHSYLQIVETCMRRVVPEYTLNGNFSSNENVRIGFPRNWFAIDIIEYALGAAADGPYFLWADSAIEEAEPYMRKEIRLQSLTSMANEFSKEYYIVQPITSTELANVENYNLILNYELYSKAGAIWPHSAWARESVVYDYTTNSFHRLSSTFKPTPYMTSDNYPVYYYNDNLSDEEIVKKTKRLSAANSRDEQENINIDKNSMAMANADNIILHAVVYGHQIRSLGQQAKIIFQSKRNTQTTMSIVPDEDSQYSGQWIVASVEHNIDIDGTYLNYITFIKNCYNNETY